MGTTEGTVNGEEEVAVVVAEAMAVDMRWAVVVGVVSVAEGAGETVEAAELTPDGCARALKSSSATTLSLPLTLTYPFLRVL